MAGFAGFAARIVPNVRNGETVATATAGEISHGASLSYLAPTMKAAQKEKEIKITQTVGSMAVCSPLENYDIRKQRKCRGSADVC